MTDGDLAKYQVAASEVGIRLISSTMQTEARTGDPRQDFLKDHEHFMRETKQELRVRTIGGDRLDLYALYKLVLERGGVQAVTANRAFKKIAWSLNLPKSCTSAATVLRTSYIDQLYVYEQKHVFGRNATPVELQSSHSRHLTPDNVVSSGARQNSNAKGSEGISVGASGRPRRQAALAASAAMPTNVDDHETSKQPRRGRISGIDVTALTPHQQALVEEEVGLSRNITLSFNPASPGDRERLVAALRCPIQSEVAWALGTLNVMSYDTRNSFVARQYPGLLLALQGVLLLYLDDILRRRIWGGAVANEKEDSAAPRNAVMSAAVVREGGDPRSGGVPGAGLHDGDACESQLRVPTLQSEETIFNVTDKMSIDRQQCAVVAVNVVRNMSFSDRNAVHLAGSKSLLNTTAEILMTAQAVPSIRHGILDMWVNIAPYINVSNDAAGGVVLKVCIQLLDPFLEIMDNSRFAIAGEILARLAASPDRNEKALVDKFPDLLPRLIDMLGSRDRRYVNAGLAALCNCSAFDWPARGKIARVPRAISRLVGMLSDPELAPRSALTLLNLAEAPSNRSILLVFEKKLVSHAMQNCPAADTVASILFDLSSFD